MEQLLSKDYQSLLCEDILAMHITDNMSVHVLTLHCINPV